MLIQKKKKKPIKEKKKITPPQPPSKKLNRDTHVGCNIELTMWPKLEYK